MTTPDVGIIIQLVTASVLSSAAIGYVTYAYRHRKKTEKNQLLMMIKIEAISAGMGAINSEYATIGRDFRNAYAAKKEELMKEHKFTEE